jgi:hypothetical protein
MDFKNGLTVNGKPILHQDNHNELGNPHPQYTRKIYYTSLSPVETTKWSKILTTPLFTNGGSQDIYFSALLQFTSDNNSVEGQLAVQIRHDSYNPLGNQYINLAYNDFMAYRTKDYYNMFALYRRLDTKTNLYCYELYMNSFFGSGVQIKVIPSFYEFFPRPWDAYKLKYVNHDYDVFLENQSWIDETSIVGSLIKKNTMVNELLYYVDATSVNTSANDKIIKTSDGKFGYVLNNVFNEFIPKPTTISITDNSTIFDVKNNAESVSLTQPSATTVTYFSNGFEGQIVQLLANNANTTLKYDNTKIKVKNAVDVNIPQFKTMMFKKFNSVWFEFYRDF